MELVSYLLTIFFRGHHNILFVLLLATEPLQESSSPILLAFATEAL